MVVIFHETVVIGSPPSPAQCRMIAALDLAARKFNKDIMVTCGEEAHSIANPHTLRKAFDIRTNDRSALDVRSLYHYITNDLGTAWTILYESPTEPEEEVLKEIWYSKSHPTGPHIHIQPVIGTNYPL